MKRAWAGEMFYVWETPESSAVPLKSRECSCDRRPGWTPLDPTRPATAFSERPQGALLDPDLHRAARSLERVMGGVEGPEGAGVAVPGGGRRGSLSGVRRAGVAVPGEGRRGSLSWVKGGLGSLSGVKGGLGSLSRVTGGGGRCPG